MKSHSKTMLDALDTLLAARVTTSDERVIQVNGRRVEFYTNAELQKEKDRMAWIEAPWWKRLWWRLLRLPPPPGLP